jgi:protein-tyrosine phosphatase
MDRANFDDLAASVPAQSRDKLSMLLQFDSRSPPESSVPDPYYGGERGFDQVVELCFAGCGGLLAHIRRQHGL